MKQEQQELEIRLLRREDLDYIVSLLHEFSPDWTLEYCRQWWENKYYKNPFGPPLAYGAFMDGILVGLESCMPIEYEMNGKKIMMLISCDSKVRESYRGRGIWGKTVRYCIESIFKNTDYPLVLGFPNFRNSYPGYMKMQWQTLDNMHNYVLVNDARQFAKVFGGNNPIKRLLGRMLGLQRLVVNMTGTSKYTIEPCGNDSLLWDDSNDRIHLSHSDEMLNWRRLYKGIKTIAVKRNGKVVATCIYSLDDFEGEQICKIEKFVVGEGSKRERTQMLAAVLKYLKKNISQAAFVRVWTTQDSDLESLCKSCLFLKSSHPNPFIIKQRGNEYDNSKWTLSFLDLD